MRLDPGAARVLALGREAGGKAFEDGTPAEARAAYAASGPLMQGPREPAAVVTDHVIAGPGGPLTLRIYRGIGAPHADAPALLYLHGGGWVIGGLESHDEICRWFANAAGAVVVCPDYRLAPEHRFPAGLDDCLAALRFLAGAAGELGVDPARIAVAGDSAGGNLAAVLALLARAGDAPALTAQLLFYPNTDARQTADSYRRYATGFGLTAAAMTWFRDVYIRGSEDIEDWRVSPLLAPSLDGVAPAFVALAGVDILADEGASYADRLTAAGVPVILRRWGDQIHGFVSMGRHIPAARLAVVSAVEAWQSLERKG